MQERIKQIPTKFVEFWNKYTGVQKTIIISVICVVLLAIGLTTYFVSRPTWVKFNEFNNLMMRMQWQRHWMMQMFRTNLQKMD